MRCSVCEDEIEADATCAFCLTDKVEEIVKQRMDELGWVSEDSFDAAVRRAVERGIANYVQQFFTFPDHRGGG